MAPAGVAADCATPDAGAWGGCPRATTSAIERRADMGGRCPNLFSMIAILYLQ